MGFLRTIPGLYAQYRKELKTKKERDRLVAAGPTEALVKELLVQAEPGVEVTLNFPGGASMIITRRPDSIEKRFNGLQTREEF